MLKRATIKVYGLVQGVNFRYSLKEKAESLGLSGWVANKEDGSVKIVAEGEENKLKELIFFAQSGYPLALVKKVEIQWSKPKGERGFEVRYEES